MEVGANTKQFLKSYYYMRGETGRRRLIPFIIYPVSFLPSPVFFHLFFLYAFGF